MNRIVALLAGLLFAGLAWSAPTVTLTAAPASGSGSVTPTLTWSSTEVASCIASGGWSGAKAISGSQVVAAIVANTVYTLTCSTATGTATLTWVAPTLRTDGSPLTNLAQYGIWASAPNANSLTRLRNTPAPATSHVISALVPGTYFFALTALDAVGLESVLTLPVSKVVTTQSVAASVTVAVQSLPMPPTSVVAVVAGINMSPAYRVSTNSLGVTSRGTAVLGHVPVGKACTGAVVYTYRGRDYRRIAQADVLWDRSTPTANVAAPCAAS